MWLYQCLRIFIICGYVLLFVVVRGVVVGVSTLSLFFFFSFFPGQLGTFFGVPVTGRYAFEELATFFSNIGQTKPLTLVMGLASLSMLGLIEFLKRKVLIKCIPWSRSIPTTFIVLVFGVILSGISLSLSVNLFLNL